MGNQRSLITIATKALPKTLPIRPLRGSTRSLSILARSGETQVGIRFAPRSFRTADSRSHRRSATSEAPRVNCSFRTPSTAPFAASPPESPLSRTRHCSFTGLPRARAPPPDETVAAPKTSRCRQERSLGMLQVNVSVPDPTPAVCQNRSRLNVCVRRELSNLARHRNPPPSRRAISRATARRALAQVLLERAASSSNISSWSRIVGSDRRSNWAM